MTAAALLLLALTLASAVADWIAVHRQLKPLEYVAKPLTMVLLLAAVLAFDPVESGAARVCFVVALVCSLAGDVFLMLPDRDRWFVFGLGAFLAGHVAYVPGLWLLGASGGGFLVGLVVVAVSLATLGRRILLGVREADPAMVAPVGAYVGVISLMVASAIATGEAWAVLGALLFYASDALIAWNRFLTPLAWGPMAIIVTYHLGQVLLALSLL